VLPDPSALYRRPRYPAEVITDTVWLYFRFNLSFRDAEDLIAEHGVKVSSEVAIHIRGGRHWLRRAVDQHGAVLDILVPSRRDRHATGRFLRQVIDGVGY
jgi:putative transposase